VHFIGMAGFTLHSDASPPLTPAQIGALRESAPAVEKPIAHAAPLGDGTIAIDGKGDDAAWSRATAVSWDTDYAGVPTGTVTRARFLHAPAGLYALFEMQGTGLHTDRSKPTDVPRPKLYDEDCVEIFFTPDPSHPHRYFETELGPFGHFLDVAVDLDTHGSDTTWSSRARIGTTQDATAHTATIEALLAAPEITAALIAGARLPLALYRMEAASPNFHVPAAFGTLVVDGAR
jgi:hypothetical protein